MVGAKLEDRLRIRRGLKAVVSAGVMRANTRNGQVCIRDTACAVCICDLPDVWAETDLRPRAPDSMTAEWHRLPCPASASVPAAQRASQLCMMSTLRCCLRAGDGDCGQCAAGWHPRRGPVHHAHGTPMFPAWCVLSIRRASTGAPSCGAHVQSNQLPSSIRMLRRPAAACMQAFVMDFLTKLSVAVACCAAGGEPHEVPQRPCHRRQHQRADQYHAPDAGVWRWAPFLNLVSMPTPSPQCAQAASDCRPLQLFARTGAMAPGPLVLTQRLRRAVCSPYRCRAGPT